LEKAIKLFNHQLQISIRKGEVHHTALTPILSALIHFNPFQLILDRQFGFLWITEILNSRYSEPTRCKMASVVVQLMEKYLHFMVAGGFHLEPTQKTALLGFLSLCKKFPESTSYPVLIVLRILSANPEGANISATALPILAPTLLPTHHLQARSLALEAFCRIASGWFSPRMKNVSNEDRDKLLQAVGDPSQFNPHIPPQDGQPAFTTFYEPMTAAVVLIAFASSELWRDHLRQSNFASCEELLSTGEGKRTALERMLDLATHSLLHTPVEITMAIRRLEELQCLNTAEVVILWAWTTGFVDPVDHDAWKLTEADTLRFYRTHGMARLLSLKRHITDTTTEQDHLLILMKRYQRSPCRVKSVQHRIARQHIKPKFWDPINRMDPVGQTDLKDLRISRACQLKRLYHLFGCNPTTWREVVVAEEVDGETDL